MKAGLPPILLTWGEKDQLSAQAVKFAAALKAQGNKVETLALPDVAHSYIGATQEITTRRQPEGAR